MTEHLELIEISGITFNIDIAINYIKDIIENSKIRSFYYLYELDESILSEGLIDEIYLSRIFVNILNNILFL